MPSWYAFASITDKLRHQAFQAAHAGRRALVLFGAKDGMVHAVHTRPTAIAASPSGTEAWAFVPPKAYTTASTTMLNADYRSWWNDGAGLTADGSYSGGIVWQKFITRLSLHGPIVPEIPCSILRLAPGEVNIIEPLAEDLKIELTA